MKKRNVVLGLILCFACVFSVFGLFGCGEASTKTLAENFEKLQKEYDSYDTVFVKKAFSNGQEQKEYLSINFGVSIQEGTIPDLTEFEEFESLYNVAFEISNDYIDQYSDFVSLLKDGELSKDARKKIDQTNKSVIAYTKEIKNFVKDRTNFVTHFSGAYKWTTPEGNLDVLRTFKTSLGELVEANVALSTNLADAVEATDIFKAIQKVDLQQADTEDLKEFIRAKMLHLFTDFKLVEIANKMTWSSVEGENKQDFDEKIITKLDESYTKFKDVFVKKHGTYKTLTKDAYSNLLDLTHEFLIEADAFSKALKEFDIWTFAKDFEANLTNYEKENKFAGVYWNKMETFVSTVLPTFIDNTSKLIFQ